MTAQKAFLVAVIMAFSFTIVSVNGLVDLGEIDGKHFFHDNTTYGKSWGNAVSICQREGLELASLETKEQTEFVVAAVQSLGQIVSCWTSGRLLTESPEAFIWDNSGNHLNSESVGTWSVPRDFHFCVYVYIGKSNFYFNRFECNEYRSGVLCQK